MAGGNYGGNSIPTTAIEGYEFITNPRVYDGYKCTSVVTSGAAATFKYDGLILGLAAGTTMELIINPGGVTASSGAIFLCYDCSCSSPMSGITRSDNYSGTTAMFRPTIIGGGGLNS